MVHTPGVGEQRSRGHITAMFKDASFSVVTFLDTLIVQAIDEGVSDIHLSAEAGGQRIRFRVDGLMETIASVPHQYNEQLIARIKVLAGLRTDEHFKAQDGRFSFLHTNQSTIDVRVSIVPIHHGPNCVLRLLAPNHNLTLETLGLTEMEQLHVERAVHNPYGLIVVTGPTGSGKTTTLYGLLKKINTPDCTIITIEDPIEYLLAGVNQIAVNEHVGLTFATGLRSIVRQDPDVIMVGEVRDTETAKLATTAALTGHVVLTTLHTNDAPSALTRLVEMGVEPYLVASTVSMVIAQRLVRVLCNACKKEVVLSASERARVSALSSDITLPMSVYQSVGCSKCRGTGYNGRVALYEVMRVTAPLRNSVLTHASADELRALALTNGMTTLLASGITLVEKGVTSLNEIFGVVYE